MQLKACFAVALVAGSVGSVAYAQQAERARGMVEAQVVKVQIGDQVFYPPFNTNSTDAPAVVYDNWPDTGGAPFYANGGLAHKCGDVISFTPGPGMNGPTKITSFDRFAVIATSAAGFAAGNVDFKFSFYDTFNAASTPEESVPVGVPIIITVGVPALTGAGYYAVVNTPVDISAANLNVPDDNFVCVEELFPQGGTVPDQYAGILMPVFNGLPFPPTTGNSADFFLYDANGSGDFESGENYYFGGTSPFFSNIGWRFTGVYNGTTGACCMPDASCQDVSNAYCTAVGGTFFAGSCAAHGACTPPPNGACCMEDGTCQSITTFACSAAGGIYRGDNIPCGGAAAACAPFGVTGDDSSLATDVGDLPATAFAVNGYGQRLLKIHGFINGSDADMYKFRVCDYTTFSASTVGGTTIDTAMALFDSTGHGISYDDDSTSGAQSLVTGQFMTGNATVYLAVSYWNYKPIDSSLNLIWNATNPGNAYYPEWQPNGPGAANAINGWVGSTTVTGNYTIFLTGACFLGCYANCDSSTTPPILNANDFQCFLNSYAGAANGFGYANCDNSSSQPILNANDFQCFLNAFAAGCPSN
jgi:hypothetical protein